MSKKIESKKPNYKKVSTITFEKDSKFTDNNSSNMIEVLEECARKERYSDFIAEAESRGWRFKGITHKVYDWNNDLSYDSKLASSGYQYHSTSLNKVLKVINKYIRNKDTTKEQITTAQELSSLITEELSQGERIK